MTWVLKPRRVLQRRCSRWRPVFCPSWKAPSIRSRTLWSHAVKRGEWDGSWWARYGVRMSTWRVSRYRRCPSSPMNPLSPQELGLPQTVQDLIPGHAFIGGGGHQVIDHRYPLPRTPQNPLVAKVLPVATGTHAVIRRRREITPALVPFVTHHRQRLDIPQIEGSTRGPQRLGPVPPQFFHPPGQTPGAPIELTLAQPPGKERQVVGPQKRQELGLPGQGQEIPPQEPCHDFTVTEDRFRPHLALEPTHAMARVPVIHLHKHHGRPILKGYTVCHGEPSKCRDTLLPFWGFPCYR